MTLTIVIQETEEVKHPRWRNDRLIRDAHNALNILITKGYLERSIFGFRGWVRELDGTSCKIVLNTEYNSKVICALLKLYFPTRRFMEVT